MDLMARYNRHDQIRPMLCKQSSELMELGWCRWFEGLRSFFWTVDPEIEM